MEPSVGPRAGVEATARQMVPGGQAQRLGQLSRPTCARRQERPRGADLGGRAAWSVRRITYGELHADVNKFANVLKGLGVRRGDRVAIYLPMVPEMAVARLACARIGAVHTVVFGGFSAESLQDRINDAAAKLLITADGGYR